MRRVYFIYAIRKLARVFAVRISLLSVFVAAASFWVSVPHILSNMPNLFNVSKFFEFFVSAFINTNFVIQLFATGSILVLFYLIRDIVRILHGNRNIALA